MAESSSVDATPQPLPPGLFVEDSELEQVPMENGSVEMEMLGGGREGGGRDGATSPQFSTTSTVSGDLHNTNPITGSNDSLEQNGDGLTNIDEQVVMDTTGGKQGGKEAVVATTTGTWERFEPAGSKSSWETFEASGEGGGEGEGSGLAADSEVNGISEATGGEGATTALLDPQLTVQPDDKPGAVCAADALVSSGWTALEEDADPRMDLEEEEFRNLPFRQTRSMRATTNRKVQIVDALKQQRRLSNTSLDRDPMKPSGPFPNEDELSRRYNIEREWQVFVKMSKRVPGTRLVKIHTTRTWWVKIHATRS